MKPSKSSLNIVSRVPTGRSAARSLAWKQVSASASALVPGYSQSEPQPRSFCVLAIATMSAITGSGFLKAARRPAAEALRMRSAPMPIAFSAGSRASQPSLSPWTKEPVASMASPQSTISEVKVALPPFAFSSASSRVTASAVVPLSNLGTVAQ